MAESANAHGIRQQLFDPPRASVTPPTNVFVGNLVTRISWEKGKIKASHAEGQSGLVALYDAHTVAERIF